MVHGDDFMFRGNDEDLEWVTKVLAAKFVIKVRAVLGPEDEDQKDEVLLRRFVRWRSWGIEWEADVKHPKLLLERFGLDGNAKALSVNGDWGDWVSTAGEDQDTDVFPDEAMEFRAAVARLNYLRQDAVVGDGQPNDGELQETEEGRPVSCWKKASCVKVTTDAEWCGDKRSRKSTSGSAAMRGKHCLRT